MMYSDHLTIILEDKIFAQRTPNSKFIEFDLNGTKINSYDELPKQIQDIVKINEDIEKNPSSYFEYRKTTDGIIINKILPAAGTHVKVPEYIDGQPVVALGEELLSYVVRQVEQIQLPNTIKKFEEYTFRNGELLRHINIPKLINNIPRGCFANCYLLNNIDLSNIKTIGTFGFEDCTSLTRANLSNIEQINDSAFLGCSFLKKVTFSDYLTILGSHAFVGCSELDDIELPNSLTKLQDRTFEQCISLQNIKFSENLKEIGQYCFKGCHNLIDFVAPKSLEIIHSGSFYGSGVENIILNKNLIEVSTLAFAKCPHIESIQIYSTTKYENSSFPYDSYDKIRTIFMNPFYNNKEKEI